MKVNIVHSFNLTSSQRLAVKILEQYNKDYPDPEISNGGAIPSDHFMVTEDTLNALHQLSTMGVVSTVIISWGYQEYGFAFTDVGMKVKTHI